MKLKAKNKSRDVLIKRKRLALLTTFSVNTVITTELN